MLQPLSPPFFALLAAAVFGNWLLSNPTLRVLWLLIAGVVFYGLIQPAALFFVVGLTLITGLLAKRMGRVTAMVGERRTWLILGIGLNVTALVSFKYLPGMLLTLGCSGDWLDQWNQWPMPLGLSFFCFESIAYLVEVSRGLQPAGLLTFASYKLFFPKLIAGPITAFQTLRLQWQRPQIWEGDRLIEGFWLIALGSFKKLVLADRLAQPVNLIFDNLTYAGSVDLWLAILAYGLQIYLDFSGYTDIARGSALLLGIWLPENFDAPYLSTSIADFWRRWHMTLGRWLREYLYIPLGGSRKGLIRTCLNLVLVMMLAGLWHGAAWGFLVWGAIHGTALAIQKVNERLSQKYIHYGSFWDLPSGIYLSWILTTTTVFFSWIFFRLPQTESFCLTLNHLLGQQSNPEFLHKVYFESIGIERGFVLIIICSVMLAILIIESMQYDSTKYINLRIKIMMILPLVYGSILLQADRTTPYVYFNF
jgi:alginate O-acetyltransferase complex protein AlgI